MSSLKKRVLIGSPIYQEPNILKEFLVSLKSLKQDSITIDFMFVDDNKNTQSTKILDTFSKFNDNCIIIKGYINTGEYIVSDAAHCWNGSLVWKVADYKNKIIRHALEQKYDYLFLVDSDILINPNTIQHLIQQNKDIVSEIFWTRWQPDAIPMPQVWLTDNYTMYEVNDSEEITDEERNQRAGDFINKLYTPGLYEVGGLGACTLISERAMKMGIGFNKIKNLTLWGEDRHFCVRAIVLGLELWVDTHYPAHHIYRESYLSDAPEFKTNNGITNENCSYLTDYKKLIVGMCVHNEANNFLVRSLTDIKRYADHIVIINDASTDNSVEICKNTLVGSSFEIINNEISQFSNEILLRKQLWNEIVKHNPEWIIILDADEIFENNFETHVRELMKNDVLKCYYFRLYDFWNETHYREDKLWNAHSVFRPFMIRYDKNYEYTWKETSQHCGRLPINLQVPYSLSIMRLKHYGWSKPELRYFKFARYMKLDPTGKYGNLEQYFSILDENPNLVEYVE